MVEAERVLMKRALELARRGSGLVSPNPMVGALLVKEGRVVGEGYHRYDLLKHAESYAIEMAGRQTRGATLYCTLEPCCNRGRTPPCTDALIAAKIARAVIAIRDPNPAVNGKGVEQLRNAGIQVDVGLCEDEARKLIESYAKYITTKLPFVHAIAEYDRDECSRSDRSWTPSSELISEVSAYDALVLGGRCESESLLVESKLKRKHHRQPVILASDSIFEAVRHKVADRAGALVWNLADFAVSQTNSGRSGLHVVPPPTMQGPDRSQVNIDVMLSDLGKRGVTSVLVTPGAFDFTGEQNFRALDKLTLIVPADFEVGLSGRLSLGELEFDFDHVTSTCESDRIELTGYPTLLEIA